MYFNLKPTNFPAYNFDGKTDTLYNIFMINFVYEQPEKREKPQKPPELILSPSDVGKITKSNLPSAKFAKEEYKEIAVLLEKLAILERKAETKLRAWKHDPEEYRQLSEEIERDVHETRKRLHDIFLSSHSYPDGPQLPLMPSDAYEHDNTFANLQFRNFDLHNIAHNIEMIARFEQELESYLTRWSDLEGKEREAMIRDTVERIREYKDHLTKILTGYHGK